MSKRSIVQIPLKLHGFFELENRVISRVAQGSGLQQLQQFVTILHPMRKPSDLKWIAKYEGRTDKIVEIFMLPITDKLSVNLLYKYL